MIAVVDYGGGNLSSVLKAFGYLGADAVATCNAEIVRAADKIVLPGVGSFGDAAESLSKSGIDSVIKEEIAKGKPFFGICLGMQLLFEKSEESVGAKGLGLLKGTVKKFPPADKVPHIGWNDLSEVKSAFLTEGSYVYFVHGYYAELCSETAAVTQYAGVRFTSAVASGNIFATQFHPEKSGEVGLEILRRFVNL